MSAKGRGQNPCRLRKFKFLKRGKWLEILEEKKDICIDEEKNFHSCSLCLLRPEGGGVGLRP